MSEDLWGNGTGLFFSLIELHSCTSSLRKHRVSTCPELTSIIAFMKCGNVRMSALSALPFRMSNSASYEVKVVMTVQAL